MRRPPDRTLVHRCPGSPAEAHEATWARTASPVHAHAHWQVAMGLSGRGRVAHRGAERIAGPGEPFVVAPGEAHALAPAGGAWRFVSVYVPATLPGAGAPPARRSPRALAEALLAAAQAIRSGSARRAEALAALRALLPELPVSPPSPVDPGVAAAEAYLLARRDRAVSVGELASALGLAPRSLARRFQAARGLSPYAFHLQARVARARELLDAGAGQAEAAAATGFADQSHLARHFTRLHGLPPGRWRQGGRNVQDPGPRRG